LDGRDSAPNPAGGTYSAHLNNLAGEEVACCPRFGPNSSLRLRPPGLANPSSVIPYFDLPSDDTDRQELFKYRLILTVYWSPAYIRRYSSPRCSRNYFRSREFCPVDYFSDTLVLWLGAPRNDEGLGSLIPGVKVSQDARDRRSPSSRLWRKALPHRPRISVQFSSIHSSTQASQDERER